MTDQPHPIPTDKPIVWIDTETTGLDPDHHEIWEIAYAIGDTTIRGQLVSHNPRTANPDALTIGGYHRRGGYPHIDSSHFELELREALRGATLAGANPAFDAAMLRARWHDTPWHYRLLDVEAYAMPALGLTRPAGLATIAEALGVALGDHTAAGDVRCVRDCYRILRDRYATARLHSDEVLPPSLRSVATEPDHTLHDSLGRPIGNHDHRHYWTETTTHDDAGSERWLCTRPRCGLEWITHAQHCGRGTCALGPNHDGDCHT